MTDAALRANDEFDGNGPTDAQGALIPLLVETPKVACEETSRSWRNRNTPSSSDDSVHSGKFVFLFSALNVAVVVVAVVLVVAQQAAGETSDYVMHPCKWLLFSVFVVLVKILFLAHL